MAVAATVASNMPDHIFYSWQSDVEPGAACRSFIQDALEKAINNIAATIDMAAREEDDAPAELPNLDHDTKGVAGSPDIGATILKKIDMASAFVADVTLVGKTIKGKPTPNPNVLLELGYALKSLGSERILMVMNTAIGGGVELLPFDLKQRKTIQYSSATDAEERAPQKKALVKRLVAELNAILALQKPPEAPPEVLLKVERKDIRIEPKVHVYELVTSLKNVSDRRINDWEITIDFPTPFLTSTHYLAKVEARSNEKRSVFVWASSALATPQLRPDESREIKLQYVVTESLRERRAELYPERVKVTASVDGRIVQRFDEPFEKLSKF